MIETERFPLAIAQLVARELRDLLEPACERIEIAGSVRRMRAEVKDLELVAIPRMETRPGIDLWGSEETVDCLTERIAVLSPVLRPRAVVVHRQDGSEEISHRIGKAYQALEYQGIPVDLFVVRPPTCPACGTIIRDVSETHGASLPTLRNGVPRPGDADVLQRGMQVAGRVGRTGPGPEEARRDVSAVRQGLHVGELSPGDLLQRSLREAAPGGDDAAAASEVDRVGAASDVEDRAGYGYGLRPGVSASASPSEHEGSLPGASAGDGAAPRPVPRAGGEGSPPERGQDGQPDREPADRDARPAERHGAVPSLPPGVPRSLAIRPCPNCGSTDAHRGPDWGVIFALRTGPGDWNTKIVTDCKRFFRTVAGGQVHHFGKVVPCPEESDFFEAVGQPWLLPWDRTVERVHLSPPTRGAE